MATKLITQKTKNRKYGPFFYFYFSSFNDFQVAIREIQPDTYEMRNNYGE